MTDAPTAPHFKGQNTLGTQPLRSPRYPGKHREEGYALFKPPFVCSLFEKFELKAQTMVAKEVGVVWKSKKGVTPKPWKASSENANCCTPPRKRIGNKQFPYHVFRVRPFFGKTGLWYACTAPPKRDAQPQKTFSHTTRLAQDDETERNVRLVESDRSPPCPSLFRGGFGCV